MWQIDSAGAELCAIGSGEESDDTPAILHPVEWYYGTLKRVIDISFAALLLVGLFPLFVMIAGSIRVSSSGPAFFLQRRVGLHGRVFKMYKFRSMYADTPAYAPSPSSSYEKRITPLGRWLRRASLDELPQLINVLLGEMSLVGPRPEMPFIVCRYTSRERERLQVKPGITGLWQLSPERAFPIHHNLHHDFRYIQHRSLRLDLAILFQTLFVATRGM